MAHSFLYEPSHMYVGMGTRQISLTATSVDGCVDSYVRETLIGIHPEADFSWVSSCVCCWSSSPAEIGAIPTSMAHAKTNNTRLVCVRCDDIRFPPFRFLLGAILLEFAISHRPRELFRTAGRRRRERRPRLFHRSDSGSVGPTCRGVPKEL